MTTAAKGPELGTITCEVCGALIPFYNLTEDRRWDGSWWTSEELFHCGRLNPARLWISNPNRPRGDLTAAGKALMGL